MADTEEPDRFESTPHPRFATQLFGQGKLERELLDAFRSDRLPQALIFTGPPGIGKATLAWRFAKFLLANPIASTQRVKEARDLTLPDDNRAAAQAMALAHPDLFLLRREYNEKSKRPFAEIRVDDVRRAIGMFQRAAAVGGYRICIVDSAEELNRSSANALLKVIEEPPPRSLFILIAARSGLLLPTLRSRARLLRLQPLQSHDIARILVSLGPAWSNLPPDDIEAACAAATGSVHDAVRHLEHKGIGLYQHAFEQLEALPRMDWRALHKLAEAAASRSDISAFSLVEGAIFDWLDHAVRRRASGDLRASERLAEAYGRFAARSREVNALNLDRKPLILQTFSELRGLLARETA